jgi:amino acid transporter
MTMTAGEPTSGTLRGGGVSPKVYERKASGLVRAASPLDVFGFNLVNGIPGIVAALVIMMVPAFYSGADPVLSSVFALLLAIPAVMLYAKLSAVFPRSGGDYIYISRLLSPPLGFAANLGITAAVLFLVAQGGVYLGGYGVGPLLRVAGIYWQSHSLVDAGNWCTTSLGTFLIGLALILVFFALFVWGGMRLFFRVQLFVIAMGTLAMVVLAVWALFASRTGALDNIAHNLAFVGGKSMAPLAHGKTPSFSLWATAKSVIWPFFAVTGAIFSAYIGGEVKRPARSQIIGMMAGVIWIALGLIIPTAAMMHLFGHPFFANLTMADPGTFGLQSTPTYVEVTALGMGSGIWAVVLLVLFSSWGLALVGVSMAVTSRCMFAWSIDRIAPAWLASVSQRWHSPYATLIVAATVGAIFDVLFAWKWLTVLGATYGFDIAYFIAAIAAIVLPYRNRSLWLSSPARGRFLGVPTLVLWAVLVFPTVGFTVYLAATDPLAAISPIHNFGQFVLFPAIILAGIVLYYVSRGVRRTQGIDLDLGFKEIPPE